MKGLTDNTGSPRRNITKSELILSAIIFFLLFRLYSPDVETVSIQGEDDDKKIFICHAPQVNLLNDHEISRDAFDKDIEWVKDLLQGVVDGTNDYGDPADSVTLSIFLPSGPPIFEAGFGKIRANESESSAPDGSSIYRMASITKMFTTAQLMLQQQRGELNLDQDVSSILDDFKPATIGWTGENQSRTITTRQLISHMSGLLRDSPFNMTWPSVPGSDPNDNLPTKPPSRAEIMENIRRIPAVNPSYTTPVYSNIGFDVAGFVAEEIARKNYTKLLERDIFRPLGMSSSSFARQAHLLERIIVPAGPESVWADYEMADDNPAGGLYSSAADLRAFGQEILGPGRSTLDASSKKAPIFTKLTTREWLRPLHIFDDGLLSIGLNWEIFTVPVGDRRMSLYSKGGTLPSFHTLFGIDPEREFGYSLLISGEPTGNTELGIRIARRFAATLDEQREQLLIREFVGFYGDDRDNGLAIEVVYGGLALTWAVVDGQDLFKQLHLGEGEGGYVALWPTGEPSVWRLAIGRPPAQPYLGCMHKFASIDAAFSKGFPIDLLVIKNGTLTYGATNRTFTRESVGTSLR